MISYLSGTVLEVEPTHIVLTVHGVGYLVSTTHSFGVDVGDKLSLYVHLAVRENALDLYGFKEKEEKTAFEKLLTIPKIGPKTAVQILSKTDMPTLKKAVSTEDPAYLTKMSGITKKTAEKIVVGLHGLYEGEGLGETPDATDGDVVDALITLGYSQRDSLMALQDIPKDITSTTEKIKYALKELNQ